MSSNNIHDKFINKYCKVKNAKYMDMNNKNKKHNTGACYINNIGIPAALENTPAYIYDKYQFNSNCIDFNTQTAINKSVSMRFAGIIIRQLAKSNGIFPDKLLMNNFYSECVDNLSSDSIVNEADKELLLLHLKQLVIILKGTGIFNKPEGSKTFIFNHVQIYFQMINSFWNKTIWNNLFPSLPEIADGINTHRSILINLMRREKGKIRIDSISNIFFKITGLGKTNDLLLISFLDFSIFTWLRYFGIINYIAGMDKDPVLFEITMHGRKMLEYMA